jgi:hypothetical protein
MNTKRLGVDSLVMAAGAFTLLLATGCKPEIPTYIIGGEVTGLESGESVSIGLNDSKQTLDVYLNEAFEFPVAEASGTLYSVSTLAAPAGKVCEISNGEGTLAAVVTDVEVACREVTIEELLTADPAVIPDVGLQNCIAAASASPEIVYVNDLTSLSCDLGAGSVSSLDGLDNFVALESLSMDNDTVGGITAVDLSAFVDLKTVQLFLTNVTTIDLSKNTELTSLTLQFNQLTTIDLSQNTKLSTAIINYNCFDAATLAELSGYSFSNYQYTPNRSDCPLVD